MLIKKIACLLVAACIAPSTVSAGNWKSSEDKGIFLYELTDGPLSVSLVCDPEGIWMPAENHVTFSVAGEKSMAGTVLLEGESASSELTLAAGTALEADNERTYSDAIAMLSSSQTITVTLGSDRFEVQTDNSPQDACYRK